MSQGCNIEIKMSFFFLQVKSEELKKRPVHCEIHRGLSDSVPAPYPAPQNPIFAPMVGGSREQVKFLYFKCTVKK